MKNHILRLIFLAFIACILTNCAPTMYVQTGGNSAGALNKSALHYIVPPTTTDTRQIKDLYPMVVNAFQSNHIALTTHKKEAVFLVTWGTESESRQRRTVVASNSSPDWNSNLNVNSYSYYGGPNGLAATGPQYASVIQSYRMQNFTINIWKNGSPKTTGAAPVWSGSATAYPQDAKNPTAIVNDIAARYGTTFAGDTEIKKP